MNEINFKGLIAAKLYQLESENTQLRADLEAANQYVIKCNNLILSQDAQLAELARQITQLQVDLEAAKKEIAILNRMVEMTVSAEFICHWKDIRGLKCIQDGKDFDDYKCIKHAIEYYRAEAEKEEPR